MLIESLMQVVYNLFALLTSPIQIPAMPDSAREAVSSVMSYITAGLDLLSCFADVSYLLLLFSLVVAVDVGILLYRFIMWIIRKIPMLGIS